MLNASELYRLLANFMRVGTVEKIDVETARVCVQSGEHLSDWLPWLTLRAGTTKTWNPPTIGEQVFCLCPMGDLNQAVVLPAIYSNANPAPQQTADTAHTVYPDGTNTTYDHTQNKLTVEIKGDAVLAITGDVSATIDGNVSAAVKGDLTATVNGKLIADVTGTASVKAGGKTTVDAPTIHLNGGAGVVTGAHICHFTGAPHGDCSAVVTAGK